MSLLSIVQAAANKVLKSPIGNIITAVGSADPNIQQLISLVNEEGQELGRQYDWQAMTNEASFSTPGTAGGILSFTGLLGGTGYAQGFTNVYNFVPLTGGTGNGAQATIQVTSGRVASVTLQVTAQGQGYVAGDVLSASNVSLGGSGAGFAITVATVGFVGQQAQGSILTLAGPDFGWIVPETMWDRTTRRPVFGPKSGPEWQQLMAQQLQGPWWQFRIRGNQLLFLPPPSPGDQIFFEWVSKYWCTNAAGTQGQTALVQDTDIAKLDEQLITLGAIVRFKSANGLPFTEDKEKYSGALKDITSRDGVRGRLNLSGLQSDLYPGVIVPAGNWPIAGSS